MFVAAFVLVLGSGCGGYKGQVEKAEQFPFERAAGEVLGAELAAAVPGGGMLLVVVRVDADDREALRQEALMAGVTASAPNFFPQPVGPNLAVAGAQKEVIEQKVAAEGWPIRAYLKWCRTSSEAAAIVSLIDFPPALKAKDISGLPPLFVYSTNGVEQVRSLVSAGAIRAAIVPRADANADAPAKGNAAEIVALRYETLK